MKVTIPKTFALEVDYDEAYVMWRALATPEFCERLTDEGREAVGVIREQLATLLSLASGASGECIPWLRGEEGKP